MIYGLIAAASVFGASCAQMLLKRAAHRRYFPFWRQYLNIWVIGGYAILLGSLLVNIFCMRHGLLVKELSIIETLSLLFVPVLSWICFREPISRQKAFGIALVVLGAMVFFA